MTQEEKDLLLKDLCTRMPHGDGNHPTHEYTYKTFDRLNKKGFDYHALIPMGLVLESSEGIYNI